MWLIKIFGVTTEEAYGLAAKISMDLAGRKYYIPLYDKTGNRLGKSFAIKEPEISLAEERVYTLELCFDSIRPYYLEEAQKMKRHFEEYFMKEVI